MFSGLIFLHFNIRYQLTDQHHVEDALYPVIRYNSIVNVLYLVDGPST